MSVEHPVSILNVSGAANDGVAVTGVSKDESKQDLMSQGDAAAAVLIKDRSTAAILAENRTPITITWKNVGVTVDLPPPSFLQKRRIRRNAAAANTKAKAGKSSSQQDTEAEGEAVDAPSTKKVILSGVSGYCQPGQLLAILGSSGAG
jgi:ABC-type multidrug transport system fused ATPase/permease subunit